MNGISYHVLGDIVATFKQQNALIDGQHADVGATMSVDRQRQLVTWTYFTAAE